MYKELAKEILSLYIKARKWVGESEEDIFDYQSHIETKLSEVAYPENHQDYSIQNIEENGIDFEMDFQNDFEAVDTIMEGMNALGQMYKVFGGDEKDFRDFINLYNKIDAIQKER